MTGKASDDNRWLEDLKRNDKTRKGSSPHHSWACSPSLSDPPATWLDWNTKTWRIPLQMYTLWQWTPLYLCNWCYLLSDPLLGLSQDLTWCQNPAVFLFLIEYLFKYYQDSNAVYLDPEQTFETDMQALSKSLSHYSFNCPQTTRSIEDFNFVWRTFDWLSGSSLSLLSCSHWLKTENFNQSGGGNIRQDFCCWNILSHNLPKHSVGYAL